ncbi:MarR family transcriptional regulator [Actinoplanes sp. NPDC049802]|uniref:MarR family winged helix-turn-helix transcriptional regulator n=1 Tax=Actinoplanes sp. NPDC049802 TaxID=3154742 RepID=UPI0034067BF3
MTASPGFGNHLVYLSTLIQRRFAQICAEHDLTTAQAQLLCLVKDQPRGMSELSQLLGLAKPGLSGLVDRTERRGLVQRTGCEQDRRLCTLISTPKGKQVGDAVYAEVAEHLPDLFEHLSPTDRHAFEQLVAAALREER